MQPTQPRELGVFQARDRAEDAHLLAMLQLGLEADHVVERAERIVLAQLHHRIGLRGRIVGVGEAHRLHRAVAQGLDAALSHHLDRQAAVEVGRALPFLEFALRAIDQRLHERKILIPVHRAVDVVLAGAAGTDLVVARLEPADVHVDRVEMHDRGDGVEESKRIGAGLGTDRLCKRGRGQRTGGDDRLVPVGRRQAGNLLSHDRNQRMGFDLRGDGGRKAVAVNRQRTASRNLAGVAAGHDERTCKPHLGMKQPDRIGLGVVGTEGIGADQFGQPFGFVGIRPTHRAHFVQDDRHARLGDLPSGFRTGKSAADNVNGVCAHGRGR